MELSTALPSQENEAPAKPVSMRGRKKHKCSVCGNSAKSRCPFYSCKGCCVKAKNPCLIHVLKGNPAGDVAQGLPEKPTTHPLAATAVIPPPYPNDSIRLRTVKPSEIMTKKEAASVNLSRLQKLKEFSKGIIEAEDLAFDRYLQNMRLLEMIFGGAVHDLGDLSAKSHSTIEGIIGSEGCESGGVDACSLATALQVRLRGSCHRRESQRQKLKGTIDCCLQRLLIGDQGDSMLDNEDLYTVYSDVRRDMKRVKVQTVEGKKRLSRMDLFVAVTEKVKQVESQEDFNSGLKTFEDNFVRRYMYNASTPDVLQATHSQELSKPVGEDYQSRPPVLISEKEVLKLGSFNDSRVDSCGVLKGWWKADLIPGKMESYVDIPTTMLEVL